MVQTQFIWRYGGKEVFLCDSFSGWTERVPMTLMEGSSVVLQAFRDLPPGRHLCKFLVDNVWCVDERVPVIQDDIYGDVSNIILVMDQEFNPPIAEAFPPAMGTKNGIPQLGDSTSREELLPLSVNEIDVSRYHLSMHLSFYTTYELLPESGEVFVLDTNVKIDEACSVMYEKGLAVVPLWDEPSKQITGMLTASDFIFILVKIHQSHTRITNERFEMPTISSLKESKHQHLHNPLIHAGPDESLQDIAFRILNYKISAVPVMDFMEGESCPRLLHIACLPGILKHMCRHFGHLLNHVPLLRHPVGGLGIGTWKTKGVSGGPPLLTLHPGEQLSSALTFFTKAQISAIPIVDEEGAFLNILCRSDIPLMIEGRIYACINLNGRTISQALALVDGGTRRRYWICKRSDSLYSIMRLLSDPAVRRLIVISENNHVEGIITLRDIFTFFLSRIST